MVKHIFIRLIGIVVVVFFAAEVANAQLSKQIRERGPLFITSLSFSHGLHRFPYDVKPGKENAIENTKKANLPVIGISQFCGFQFSPFIAVGVGLNFEYWTVKNAFIPVYLDVRGNMTARPFAPHWYINIGYANRWNIDSRPYRSGGNGSAYIIHGAKSGVMGEVGLGFRAAISRTASIVLTVFARAQESSLRYYQGDKPALSVTPLLVNADANSMYIFGGLKVGVAF